MPRQPERLGGLRLVEARAAAAPARSSSRSIDCRSPATRPARPAPAASADGAAPLGAATAATRGDGREREVLGGDQAAVAEDRRALEDVAQLAHVARPVIVEQQLRARRARCRPAAGRGRGRSPRGTLRSAAGCRRAARAAAAAGSRTRSAGSRGPRGTARCAIARCRSRLVAATMRASVRSTRVPPRRWNSRSCSTRRNLACAGGLISPTSSRNSVPPAACSSCPGLLCVRAGERAALVAEQLGFEQLLGQRRAVQRDERAVACAARRDGGSARRLPCRCPIRRAAAPSCRSRRTCVACVSTCAPLGRLADDAAVAGARVELLGQRPHARLEPRRRAPSLRRRACDASSAALAREHAAPGDRRSAARPGRRSA